MHHDDYSLHTKFRLRPLWWGLGCALLAASLWWPSLSGVRPASAQDIDRELGPSPQAAGDAAVGGGQAPAGANAANATPAAPREGSAQEGSSPDGSQTQATNPADAAGEEASNDSLTEPTAEDAADDAAETAWYRVGLLGLFLDGGLFMWPIALMGILAVGVIIERYRSLKMLQSDRGNVRGQVLEMLQEDRIEDALLLCEQEEGPVPAVLSSGLRKYYVLRRLNYEPEAVEPQVVKAMDDYSVHIVAALEKNLAILATVASAAPMLGFLGTVQGMIVAFGDIVAKMGETNIVEAAAGGIQVSLLTTCFGLIVGIPAFVAFNYFTSVANRYVLDVEESATDLVESVTLQMALSKKPVA